MELFCPYVAGKLAPETRAALEAFAPWTQFVELPVGDLTAYGRLIRTLWRERESFALCEQDVVPTAPQLDELMECPGEWCTHLYADDRYPDGPMLGLAKFSAAAMKRWPGAMDDALVVGNRRDIEVSWWEVDARIARDFEIKRLPWCLHDSRVRHLHTGPLGQGMP